MTQPPFTKRTLDIFAVEAKLNAEWGCQYAMHFWEGDADFPRPFRLAGRRYELFWRRSEIDSWLKHLAETRTPNWTRVFALLVNGKEKEEVPK